jgi:hypothetical protein
MCYLFKRIVWEYGVYGVFLISINLIFFVRISAIPDWPFIGIYPDEYN